MGPVDHTSAADGNQEHLVHECLIKCDKRHICAGGKYGGKRRFFSQKRWLSLNEAAPQRMVLLGRVRFEGGSRCSLCSNFGLLLGLIGHKFPLLKRPNCGTFPIMNERPILGRIQQYAGDQHLSGFHEFETLRLFLRLYTMPMVLGPVVFLAGFCVSGSQVGLNGLAAAH